MTGPRASEVDAKSVLHAMAGAIQESLGNSIELSQIRYDVDIFDNAANVVVGRRLDSLDIIEIIAAIESALGLSIAEHIDMDGAITLRALSESLAPYVGRLSQ